MKGFLWGVFVFCAFRASAQPLPPAAVRACLAVLHHAVANKQEGFQNLSPEQRAFLENHLLPSTGMRGLMREPLEPRTCRVVGGCFVLGDFASSKNLRFEWVEGIESPEYHSTATDLVMRIPKGFDFSKLPNNGRDLMHEFLMGHELHPFLADKKAGNERLQYGEPSLLPKEVQIEAETAAVQALMRGERSFLFVAPTGTGKTKVLTDVLKHQIQFGKKKLNIVVADSNLLVGQLHGDVAELHSAMKGDMGREPFRIVRWGGEFKAGEIEALAREVESSDVPVVLVTTIQSLKARTGKPLTEEGRPSPEFEAKAGLLRKMLETFAYDEAHHSGAAEARDLIDALIHHRGSTAFLYGTTATPTHREVNIQELFGNRAFWAYLDTAASYAATKTAFHRSMTQVMQQLEIAVARGETTPIGNTYALDPAKITGKGEEPLFVPPKDRASIGAEESPFNSLVINPTYYGNVANHIQPLLRKHKKGFLTVSTIKEAVDLTQVLNTVTPGKTFGYLHSKMKDSEQREVIARFKGVYEDGTPVPPEKRLDFLVTIRMFDEGLNNSDISLYIDLNYSVAPRQLLQRIGRTLRPALGKEEVEIAAFFPMESHYIEEQLALLDHIIGGNFRGKRKTGPKGPPQGPEMPEGLQMLDEAGNLEALRKLRESMRSFWNKNSPAIQDAQRVNSFWRESGRDKDVTGSRDLPSSDARSYPKEAEVRKLIMARKRNKAFLDALDPAARMAVERLQFEDRAKKLRKEGTEKEAAQFFYDYAWTYIELPSRAPSSKEARALLLHFLEYEGWEKSLHEDVKGLMGDFKRREWPLEGY